MLVWWSRERRRRLFRRRVQPRRWTHQCDGTRVGGVSFFILFVCSLRGCEWVIGGLRIIVYYFLNDRGPDVMACSLWQLIILFHF